MPTARFARASAPAASCRCARSPVTPLSTARAHTQHRHRTCASSLQVCLRSSSSRQLPVRARSPVAPLSTARARLQHQHYTHAAPAQHARCMHVAPKTTCAACTPQQRGARLVSRQPSTAPASHQHRVSTAATHRKPSVSTARARAFAHSHAVAGASISASASPPRTHLHLPAQAWRARARSSGELHAAARRTMRTTAMLTRHAGICKSNLPNTAFALCMHAARRSPFRLCAFASPAAAAPPLHQHHPAQQPRQHKSRPQALLQHWAAAGNPCTPHSSAGCR